MGKLKIYLETTLFNFYFDEYVGMAHTATLKLEIYSPMEVIENE
jgi:hypothetical protein